jgi:hypothetical protein
MQKLITHVALFRFGVNKFTEEVNSYLAIGWSIVDIQIKKEGLLRIVCYALLMKEE